MNTETKKQPITLEMYEALNKPLPPNAVLPHPTKKFLSTIKAIFVVERLNQVFGVGMWTLTDELIRQDSKHIVVKATLTFEEYIGTVSAYGGNDNADLGDAYKGAVTDALTKICSFIGIGMSVFKGEGNLQEEKPQQAPQQAQAPQTVAAKPTQEKAPQTAPLTAETLIDKAAAEMRLSKSRNDMAKVWNSYPALHENVKFLEAMKEVAAKYPRPQEAAA